MNGIWYSKSHHFGRDLRCCNKAHIGNITITDAHQSFLKLHPIILSIKHETNFTLLTDNLCDNALDLPNGILIVEDNLPDGTYCQWLISTQDNDGYVTLEFQNFYVRNSISFKRKIFNYANNYLSKTYFRLIIG